MDNGIELSLLRKAGFNYSFESREVGFRLSYRYASVAHQSPGLDLASEVGFRLSYRYARSQSRDRYEIVISHRAAQLLGRENYRDPILRARRQLRDVRKLPSAGEEESGRHDSNHPIGVAVE